MGHVPVLYKHDRGPAFPVDQRLIGLGGSGWYRTTAEVMADITSGRNHYSVTVNGRLAPVVIESRRGAPHLVLARDRGLQRLLRLPDPPPDFGTYRRALTGARPGGC